MPSVPLFNDDGSTPRPFPAARVTTDAPIESFGSDRGQAAQTAINIAEQNKRLFLEEKQKADTAAITKAYEQAASLKNNLEWNPKDGAMNTKGENAFGVINQYAPKFDSGLKEIEAGLSNEDQRAKFHEIKGQLTNDFMNGLNRHIGVERNRVDAEKTESGVKVAHNDAILNAYIPNKLKNGLEIQRAILTGYAERTGKPAEWLKENVMEANSKTNLGAIEKFVNDNNVGLAKSYLKKSMQGDIPGLTADDYERAQNLLKTGGVKAESQFRSDKIYGMGLSLTDALSEARKIKDPDIRDATEARIKQRYSDDERAIEMDNKKNFDRAYKLAYESGDLDSVPVSLITSLHPEQQKAIYKTAGYKRDGVVIQTDPIEEQLFLARLSNPATQQEAANENLRLKPDKFSEGSLNRLEDLQNGVKNQSEKATKELNSYLSSNVMARATLTSAGIDTTPKDEDAANNLALFMNAYTKKAQLFYEQSGKYPNDEQKQSIMDNLILDVEQKGEWFIDPNRKVYQVESGKKILYGGIEIPDGIAEQIAAGLRKRGLPVTQEAIAERYLSVGKR